MRPFNQSVASSSLGVQMSVVDKRVDEVLHYTRETLSKIQDIGYHVALDLTPSGPREDIWSFWEMRIFVSKNLKNTITQSLVFGPLILEARSWQNSIDVQIAQLVASVDRRVVESAMRQKKHHCPLVPVYVTAPRWLLREPDPEVANAP